MQYLCTGERAREPGWFRNTPILRGARPKTGYRNGVDLSVFKFRSGSPVLEGTGVRTGVIVDESGARSGRKNPGFLGAGKSWGTEPPEFLAYTISYHDLPLLFTRGQTPRFLSGGRSKFRGELGINVVDHPGWTTPLKGLLGGPKSSLPRGHIVLY